MLKGLSRPGAPRAGLGQRGFLFSFLLGACVSYQLLCNKSARSLMLENKKHSSPHTEAEGQRAPRWMAVARICHEMAVTLSARVASSEGPPPRPLQLGPHWALAGASTPPHPTPPSFSSRQDELKREPKMESRNTVSPNPGTRVFCSLCIRSKSRSLNSSHILAGG